MSDLEWPTTQKSLSISCDAVKYADPDVLAVGKAKFLYGYFG